MESLDWKYAPIEEEVWMLLNGYVQYKDVPSGLARRYIVAEVLRALCCEVHLFESLPDLIDYLPGLVLGGYDALFRDTENPEIIVFPT